MKMKLLISSSLLILVLAFIVQVLLRDIHLNWQIKMIHYYSKLIGFYYGLETPNFSRARFEQVRNLLAPTFKTTNNKFENGLLIEELEIDSKWEKEKDKASKFKIRVYVPEFIGKEKFPVLININGGSFVVDIGLDRSLYYGKSGLFVITVGYRLAPEHKFPTAVEDCYSALIWLNESIHPLLKYADLDRITVIGDSAGGNLAATLSHLVRDRNYPRKISHQILIYPGMILKEATESSIKYADGYLLSNELKLWFYKQYLNDESDFENPLANPLKNTNFSNLPPALFIFATDDILYSEGHFYMQKLNENSIPVEKKEYTNIHGFYNMIYLNLDDLDAFNHIINYLKKHNFIN